MEIGKNLSVVLIGAFITVLGVSYFYLIRSDSTILLALSSILGGLVGYIIGKGKKGERRKQKK